MTNSSMIRLGVLGKSSVSKVTYLPARKLRPLIKELRVCADSLHQQLEDTRQHCALIEEMMREIRYQSCRNQIKALPTIEPPHKDSLKCVSSKSKAEIHLCDNPNDQKLPNLEKDSQGE